MIGRALGGNPSPAVRRRTGPGSAPTRASARHRADPGMAWHRPSGHDCRARGDLSRRTAPLAVRGCPPDHRRPLVGAAVLRGEAMNTATPPARGRCAVYTRKSSEDGLEQDFNSLHAQREACEAFIRSPRSEGWRLIETAYDDGGLSGGSLERPALQRLFADIARHQIDTVVVYKVDRLTRSLMDFAKIVELVRPPSRDQLLRRGDTAVQHDDPRWGGSPSTSFLSFAQFERDVIGERVRDKIAASRRRRACGWAGSPLLEAMR